MFYEHVTVLSELSTCCVWRITEMLPKYRDLISLSYCSPIDTMSQSDTSERNGGEKLNTQHINKHLKAHYIIKLACKRHYMLKVACKRHVPRHGHGRFHSGDSLYARAWMHHLQLLWSELLFTRALRRVRLLVMPGTSCAQRACIRKPSRTDGTRRWVSCHFVEKQERWLKCVTR